MPFWDNVKTLTAHASAAALEAGQKTKLKTEILWADRELNVRQRHFGVELYDHVAPMSTQASFWEANSTDDDFNGGNTPHLEQDYNDRLVNTLRPALLETQREISVLELRRVKQKQRISQAEVTRQAAFPKKAETLAEKVMQVGVAAGMAGNSAKLNAELAMIDAQIKGHKEEFGVRMYAIFSNLEDTQGWLPTDRHIRSMYDQTRRDLEQIELKRATKESELTGVPVPASKSVSVNASPMPTQPGYGHQTRTHVPPQPPTPTTFGAYRATNGNFTPQPPPPQTPPPSPYEFHATSAAFASQPPAYGVSTPGWASTTAPAHPPTWAATPATGSFPYASPTPPAPTYHQQQQHHHHHHQYGGAPNSFGNPAQGAPPAATPTPAQPYDPFSLYAATNVPTLLTQRGSTRRARPPPPPGSDLLDFQYTN